LWMDVRTDGQTLRPAVLGQLGGVDLKILHHIFVSSTVVTMLPTQAANFFQNIAVLFLAAVKTFKDCSRSSAMTSFNRSHRVAAAALKTHKPESISYWHNLL